jgi:phenylacetate-CoA ligase
MSAATAAAWGARTLFQLQEYVKGHDSVQLRRQLEQSQWWTPAMITELQLLRLRALLLHAQEHVPYYRDLFARAGFNARSIHDLRDLRCLPVLRKRDINRHTGQFRSTQAGPLQRLTTGGSSGEALAFYLGRRRISHDVAAKWRATRWWKVDIGDREAVVWGSPIELKAQDHWRRLRDHLLRTTLLPAFDLSAKRMDLYLETLRRERPAMMFGYPSALSRIASHARSRAVPLDDIGVRVVFATAECLYPHQRSLMEDVFGSPVANGYGGRDAGFIAHECPAGGMHISAEDIIVEILDPAGRPVPAGQSGEIVITHLATHDFPFIRYGTGDIGAIEHRQCSCGRGLPLLGQLDGRSTDFIVAQDGTTMHGLALIYILREQAGISAFKIIQESIQRTRILVVQDQHLQGEQRNAIVAQFKARLGQDVEILIEQADAIQAEPSGKHRYVISKVTQESQPCYPT